jgi:hypothetical protein
MSDMAVKIGHAVYDESRKSVNGAAGDQTGKEICRWDWYNKPWTEVFRPKDNAVAEKIAKAMEQACDNNKIGYDQYQRTTLYTKAKAVNWNISKITAKCECDCSALVAVCVNAAGISVSKDMYTGNEKSVLTATKKFELLDTNKYLGSSNYLKRGDILLGKGHTAVALTDGKLVDEYDREDFVREVQTALKLPVTGVCNNKTLDKTVTISAKKNKKHVLVKPVQKYLYALGYTQVGNVDGVAGAKFTAAIKAFQKDNGCTADGEITAKNKTWKKLLGMN